ncbi:TIGR03826 family flagellar region protein [Pseudalkalibacillus decolorationis]|uniref:TIGR03826 family flagellar region protein n=1 Tax=Pseudalkalibacillus decolorationis TaxID=163879 RepID=UPI002147229F|nr:TIGR03826 family flagellar region protein [Pseudalkalibacillus decolorationis]
MAELANCPQCNRIFVKNYHVVCDTCYKEEEEMFDKVYKFIRKKANREASLWEVYEATGVPEKVIIRFVKEGRIRANQLPNISYPCESCGLNINDGRICNSCKKRMNSDLRTHDHLTQKEMDNNRITYYTEK